MTMDTLVKDSPGDPLSHAKDMHWRDKEELAERLKIQYDRTASQPLMGRVRTRNELTPRSTLLTLNYQSRA